MVTTYGPMLTATHRVVTETVSASGERKITYDTGERIIEPPLSQEFVMSRVYKSTQIIFFEAVRRTLLWAGDDEDKQKTAHLVVELVMEAEKEPYVSYPLMSDETAALLSNSDDSWSHLETAEPPAMKDIAEVPWLAYEVYTLVRPNGYVFYNKLKGHQTRIANELWPPPEPAEETADSSS